MGIELSRLDEKKASLMKENGKLLQEEEVKDFFNSPSGEF